MERALALMIPDVFLAALPGLCLRIGRVQTLISTTLSPAPPVFLIQRVCLRSDGEEGCRGCSASKPSDIPLIIVLLWCGPTEIVLTVHREEIVSK